jgi:ERF superfamily protein
MNETAMPAFGPAEEFGGLQYVTPHPSSAISEALAKAQGDFGPVLRDKTVIVTMRSGGKYTFSYAPLESILHAVKPALSKNGLSLTQAMVVHEGKDFVETTLRHASGQTISNRIPLFVKEEGPQAYGSALTYARRYGVTLLLCISADDDDDGNAAEGNTAETQKSREPSTSAKLLASSFKAALKAGIDGKVNEVHQANNADQELYLEAWQLLTPAERREIKAAIERVKNPNTNRQSREPVEA